ncbi:hypothetical protein WAJ11_21920, partial [Acinetobacter baumannii]
KANKFLAPSRSNSNSLVEIDKDEPALYKVELCSIRNIIFQPLSRHSKHPLRLNGHVKNAGEL